MSFPTSVPKPIKSRRYSSQFMEEVDYAKATAFQAENNELRDGHGKISPITNTTELSSEASIWGKPFDDDKSERITTHSSIRMVRPDSTLGYYAMISLLFNKIVGTGIFEDPTHVLKMSGSKGAALVCWFIGSLIAISGSVLYVEYGIRFPLTGGELYYLDFVWLKPTLLLAYMYGIMFVALRNSHANSLTFGNAVQTAVLPEKAQNDPGIQRVIAVAIVGITCLAHAHSRKHYIAISNVTAPFKFLLLVFVIILGLLAYGGVQSSAGRKAYPTQYGKDNLNDAFTGTSTHSYFWGMALLIVSRSFSGFENANLIIEEVRRPLGDEYRVFRRSVKYTILMVALLYMLCTLAFYIVLTDKELRASSDIFVIFLQKIFGPSRRMKQASGVLRAISSLGQIVSFTYAHVKVKQEVARMGILPFPEYFAKSTADGIPGPALLMHFVISTIVIVAVPSNQTSLVFSILNPFARTWVAVLLGLGLLYAWRLESFRQGGENWRPRSFPKLGKKVSFYVVMPMVLFYTVANVCFFVFMWITSVVGNMAKADPRTIPAIKWPILASGLSVLGGLFWLWDRVILPKLGYRFEAKSEHLDGYVVQIDFVRYIKQGGPAQRLYDFIMAIKQRLIGAKRWMTSRRRRRSQEFDSDSEYIPLQQIYKTSDNKKRIGLRNRKQGL